MFTRQTDARAEPHRFAGVTFGALARHIGT
jgi:hypothetical protein